MESLQDLINQIKEEGVSEAKRESERLINDAVLKAKEIKARAEQEAEDILSGAREEAERFKKNSEKTLEQAGRNLILAVRSEIECIFDAVVKEKVGDTLSPNILKEIIVKLMENWQEIERGEKLNLEVLLNEKDKKQLQSLFTGALASKLKSGVEIKAASGVKKGFMIGEKGSNIYYDITDTGIAEALVEYLNPRLREIIENAKNH